MCGRYSLSTPLEDLIEEFEVRTADLLLTPRFNIAPTDPAPVIVLGKEGRRLGLLRWGLVPWWADDPRIGARMINARSEGAATTPAFRDPFRRRRCLVPADGFYEWRKEEGRKAPYWVHRADRRPFALAGLWDRWRPKDGGGDPIHSFTILTVDPSPDLATIHDRMPVVLHREARERWLDPGADEGELAGLLRPAPDGSLEAWEVSTLVNKPENDLPGCIEPLPPDERVF